MLAGPSRCCNGGVIEKKARARLTADEPFFYVSRNPLRDGKLCSVSIDVSVRPGAICRNILTPTPVQVRGCLN